MGPWGGSGRQGAASLVEDGPMVALRGCLPLKGASLASHTCMMQAVKWHTESVGNND